MLIDKTYIWAFVGFQSGENSLLESGKFSIEDSCTLLKLVLNQQRTSNFEDVDYDKIDFDAIAQQMLR